MKRFIAPIIIFTALGASAETPEFLIPVEVAPGGQVVLVPSYDDEELDLERYIDLSNETGLYPSWGWTGEYYITGVTHGPVEKFEPGVTRLGSSDLYSSQDSNPGTVVPSPSSGAAGLLLLGFGMLRRRR